MREPVTTTSCNEVSVFAAVAGAVCAFATPKDAASEPPVSARRTAIRSRGFPRFSFSIERLSGYSNLGQKDLREQSGVYRKKIAGKYTGRETYNRKRRLSAAFLRALTLNPL